jgi:hypothetical protein
MYIYIILTARVRYSDTLPVVSKVWLRNTDIHPFLRNSKPIGLSTNSRSFIKQNTKCNYCVHNSLATVPILIQINPIYILTPHFPKIHFILSCYVCLTHTIQITPLLLDLLDKVNSYTKSIEEIFIPSQTE